MSDGSEHKEETNRPVIVRPFHKRFNIEVDIEDAKQRFVNRLYNRIDEEFLGIATEACDLDEYVRVFKYIAIKLGIKYDYSNTLEDYSGSEFLHVLRTFEALYEAFIEMPNGDATENLDTIIKSTITESEIDLGIQFRDGVFRPSGAKVLDEDLVNEPLKWLADPKYKNVLEPFQKGLRHYLEASRDPNRLSDTVTDMYEALEALAKTVCGNKKDLSANRELLVSKLGLSQYYARMLRDHIDYASDYRHGVEQTKERVPPKHQEVEAFIYSTGLFIRLAIRQLAEK